MKSDIESITRHGKPYVAVPVATYKKMISALSDSVDTAEAVAALQAIRGGTEETIPASIVFALAEAEAGGGRLKICREYRKKSKALLGRETGVTGQFIGQIEKGEREGGPRLFRAFADALHCHLDHLL